MVEGRSVSGRHAEWDGKLEELAKQSWRILIDEVKSSRVLEGGTA